MEDLERWQMVSVTARREDGDHEEANRLLAMSLDEFLGEQLVNARVMRRIAPALSKLHRVRRRDIEAIASKLEAWLEEIIEARKA